MFLKSLQDPLFRIAIKREALKRSYYLFFKYMWETVVTEPLIESPYHKYLCDELQLVGERLIQRKPKLYDLLINISPGFSKTTLVTILFNAWLWVNDPSLRVLSVSHTVLAIENSEKLKDCIKSERFRELFGDIVKIKPKSDNKKHYKTTAMGERKSVSTGGSMTGMHAHLQLMDDLCDAKDARTIGGFVRANDVVSKTISSRKVNRQITVAIMVMQRLGVGDPSDLWIKKNKVTNGIKHICLPASDNFPIFPPNIKNKLYINGLLDPHRHSYKVLKDAQTELGTRDYTAQYGQSPIKNKGGLIESQWFGRFDYMSLVHQIIAAGEPVVHHFTIDPADEKETETSNTKETKSDYTAICSYILWRKRMYIYHIEAFKKEFSDKCDYVKQWVKENGYTQGSKIIIEPTASGRPLISILKRETTFNVIEGKYPIKSKYTRVKIAARTMEARRVYFRDNAHWIDKVNVEFEEYPSAAFHDDQLDSVVMAINDLTSEDEKPKVKASSSIH
ncbi:MAG: phage terminase large subunit [Chitinophagales bacterium]